jgi:DNA-binding NarL/FixJ family response regulator
LATVSTGVVGVVRDLLLGEGLARVLTDVPHLEFALLQPDDPQLVAAVADADPDVVIMDTGFAPAARAERLALAVELRATNEAIGLILLDLEPDLDVARALIEQGPSRRGYLLYDGQLGRGQLLTAIRQVAAGGSAVDERIIAALLERNRAIESSPLSGLSERQTAVLAEVARGKSNAAIAQTLGITKKSVEHHISAIFNRLDLPDEEDVSRRVTATLLHLRATLASDHALELGGTCTRPPSRGAPPEGPT